MKGDAICTVRVPNLQTGVPFYGAEGNPCSTELTGRKARIKHVEQVEEKRSRT